MELTDRCSWDLPDDVFDAKAGEVKPSKPVKKVVKAPKVEPKGVRRSISEVEVNPFSFNVFLWVS